MTDEYHGGSRELYYPADVYADEYERYLERLDEHEAHHPADCDCMTPLPAATPVADSDLPF